MPVSSDNLEFLRSLSKNNNKEWFEEHKSLFLTCKEEILQFHDEVRQLLEQHDRIERGKVFRIYRDVRFSKDKSPYKTYWSGTYQRATDALRGGYYFQIEPGKSYLAGGFFGPNSQDLLHLRKQISQDPEPLLEVLNSRSFRTYFGELQGERVKTAPKGFMKEDPNIGLIRFKQFIVRHHFDDKEVIASNFAMQMNEGFRLLRPFFDVMSTYLTTDLDGVSLI